MIGPEQRIWLEAVQVELEREAKVLSELQLAHEKAESKTEAMKQAMLSISAIHAEANVAIASTEELLRRLEADTDDDDGDMEENGDLYALVHDNTEENADATSYVEYVDDHPYDHYPPQPQMQNRDTHGKRNIAPGGMSTSHTSLKEKLPKAPRQNQSLTWHKRGTSHGQYRPHTMKPHHVRMSPQSHDHGTAPNMSITTTKETTSFWSVFCRCFMRPPMSAIDDLSRHGVLFQNDSSFLSEEEKRMYTCEYYAVGTLDKSL
jgi:hypothetical protein